MRVGDAIGNIDFPVDVLIMATERFEETRNVVGGAVRIFVVPMSSSRLYATGFAGGGRFEKANPICLQGSPGKGFEGR